MNVLNTNLSGKVAVVTGAGGVLCSNFSKVLARAGATVALLDINLEAAQAVADAITNQGGIAKAFACNVLDKASCYAVADEVEKALGKCDILINGAGGNNPKATTDKEYFEPGDIDADTKSFFDLDADGVGFVFNLNFLGTLLPTQAFASPAKTEMVIETDGQNPQHWGVLNAWADAILHGGEMVADGTEGINGLMLSNAMHLSSFLGKAVELPIDEDLYYEELMKGVATSRVKKDVKTVFADTSNTYAGSK